MKTDLKDRLPRRGGALSRVVSAFRIERKQVKETGTHKRLYADQGEVSEKAFETEVGSVVAALFSHEYLFARGLPAHAAVEHNEDVGKAVGDVLKRWDRLSVLHRHGQDQLPQNSLGMLVAMLGFDHDLLVRAAAYDHLYGHFHPVREQLPMFWRKDGLKDWWSTFKKRLRESPSLNDLHRATGLSKNTLKGIKGGSVPGGGVLVALAKGLARLTYADTTVAQSAPEIEFDVRVAAAVQEVRKLIGAKSEAHQAIPLFQFFKAALSDVDRAGVRELLLKGIEAQRYPDLQEALSGQIKAGLLAGMANRANYLKHLCHLDPLASSRMAAEALRATLVGLRNDNDRHGVSRLVIEFFEYMADFSPAVFAGRKPPEFGPEKLAKVNAIFRVFGAFTPWDRKTPERKEALIREAIHLDPTSTFARTRLASLLNELGRRDEALQEYREIVRIEPHDPIGWFMLAGNLTDLGRWSDAIAVLDSTDVSSLDLRACRGVCLAELDQLDEAERILKAVIGEDRQNVYALDGLARVHGKRGDPRTASKLLRKAWFLAGRIEGRCPSEL